ncbi:hypothetical protein [Kitasatospora herbaricolor]|uniref:hypothetical protein n=1 Tax=Kitasatospora herbaricolor TaxID=68217 RepID=UPI0036DF0C24
MCRLRPDVAAGSASGGAVGSSRSAAARRARPGLPAAPPGAWPPRAAAARPTGGPDAWLVFDLSVARGLRGLKVGQDVLLPTWLHRADREVPARSGERQ